LLGDSITDTVSRNLAAREEGNVDLIPDVFGCIAIHLFTSDGSVIPFSTVRHVTFPTSRFASSESV
jgi:hypothetical protein